MQSYPALNVKYSVSHLSLIHIFSFCFMRSIYLIELGKYSGFYIILYSWSFIFQNELNRIPVSYTHLDVYKRQIKNCIYCASVCSKQLCHLRHRNCCIFQKSVFFSVFLCSIPIRRIPIVVVSSKMICSISGMSHSSHKTTSSYAGRFFFINTGM